MHLRPPRLEREEGGQNSGGLTDRVGLVCLPNHNDGGNERTDELKLRWEGRKEEEKYIMYHGGKRLREYKYPHVAWYDIHRSAYWPRKLTHATYYSLKIRGLH